MLRKKLKLSSLDEQNEPYKMEKNTSNEPQHKSNELNNLSNYFIVTKSSHVSIPIKMLQIQQHLNRLLENINLLQDPISYIYNPTLYASEPLEQYFNLYCKNEKKIIFMGMNPGPWGMCQTGIPFGEVSVVRDWLCINGYVGQPSNCCKKRKIEGFNCTRKEISGDRFWNYMKNLCGSPQKFFNNCFVYNYCPLAFMKEDGKNVTPADMEIILRNALQEVCNVALQEVILTLKPDIIIGVGRYAEERALNVVKLMQQDIQVLYLTHPSPRSPNNKNWVEKADQFMNKNNLIHYFQ